MSDCTFKGSKFISAPRSVSLKPWEDKKEWRQLQGKITEENSVVGRCHMRRSLCAEGRLEGFFSLCKINSIIKGSTSSQKPRLLQKEDGLGNNSMFVAMAEETGTWLFSYLLATTWGGGALDFEFHARKLPLGDHLKENFNQADLGASREAQIY